MFLPWFLSHILIHRFTQTSLRQRLALALRAAARLGQTGQLNTYEKGCLKEKILSKDKRVIAAIEVYEVDGDAEEMLDTLMRIAMHA